MPVEDLHPQYVDYQPDWERSRDAFGGARPVKAKGTKYLPWMEEQLAEEYTDYLTRAQWFDATERTTLGLSGAILRNDTRIEVPAAMEPHLEDVTLSGQGVQAFSLRIVMDQILMSRVGVEVAMPPEETSEQRPYWNLWAAESITNWAEARINGQVRLIMVVLQEPAQERDGLFTWKDPEVQYRVLLLLPDERGSGDLVYRQQVWVKNPDQGAKEKYILAQELFPTRRGVPLNEIPFTFFGASTIEAKVQKPALLGLVNANYGLYMNSADYETALSCIKPLYFFTGLDSGAEIVLGSRRAVIADDTDGDGKILQGADPVGLREAMKEKKKDIAALGGAMFEPEGGQAETLGAVRIRHGGRQASLRTIAGTFGVGLKRVLGHHAMWVGAESDAITVDPNMDFIDTRLPPEELNALMAALQENKISYATFYHNLKGGEIARPGVDKDEEVAEIEEDKAGELNALEEEARRLEAARVDDLEDEDEDEGEE